MIPFGSQLQVDIVHCCDRRCCKHNIAYKIDHDMRNKPGALQRRHQRLVEDFRMKHVDAEEKCRERHTVVLQPSDFPAVLNKKADERNEGCIPQSGLAKCSKRWTVESRPVKCNKSSHYC